MKNIISFDMDGTLMKHTYADLIWLEGLPKIYAKEKHVNFKIAKQEILRAYDEIGSDRIEWYDLPFWFRHFQLVDKWTRLLEDYSYAIEMYPETYQIISNLSKKYTLVLTSNAKKEFIHIQLTKTKTKKFFSHVFSSTSDFLTVKKDNNFYKKICANLNISPREMIHIGDHWDYDYIIPKSIGICAYYLDRQYLKKGKNIVNNLCEFAEQLDGYTKI
jgi:putative hydrolase of the HAD superfamily